MLNKSSANWFVSFVLMLGVSQGVAQQSPPLDGLMQELEKSMREEEKPKRSELSNDPRQALEKLKAVQEMMNQAALGLRKGVTSEETQRQQQQAIALMDELLKGMQENQSAKGSKAKGDEGDQAANASSQEKKKLQANEGNSNESGEESMKEGSAEAQNGSSEGGSRASASNGNTPSSVAGPGNNVPVPQGAPVERLSQGVWGHLPDRVRRDLQAVSPEQYLPAYRAKIEAYYRRLAEQNAK